MNFINWINEIEISEKDEKSDETDTNSYFSNSIKNNYFILLLSILLVL